MYSDRLPAPFGGVLAFFAFFFAVSFAIVPPYLDFRVHENIGLNFHRVLVVLALVSLFFLFFLSGSVWRRLSLVVQSNGAVFLFCSFYLIFRVLSLLVNPTLYAGFLLVNEVLMNFLVLIFFSISLGSVGRIRSFFIFSVLGAVFVSGFVFVESLVGNNFFSGFADISTAAGKVAAESKYRDGSFRVQGAFEHPLALAQYFLLVLPMLISGFAFERNRSVVFVLAVAFLGAAYLTKVRTFYVAMLFGAAFYFCVRFLWGGRFGLSANSRLSVVILFLPVALVALFYKVYEVAFMGSAAELSSTVTRFGQIYNGLIGIVASPIWGHGIGMAKEVIIGIGLNDPSGVVIWNETIDNFYLGLALDSGVFALTFYVVFFICSIYSGVSVYRDRRNLVFVRRAALSVSVSIFCAFVSMFVLSIFTVLPFVFALVGVNCALSALSARSDFVFSKA